MKLRFSNGHDFAIEFEANDPESFYREGWIAIREFRIATARRVHRGEIHKTVYWFESATLHIADETGRWFGTGTIETLNSPGSSLDGAGFFVRHPVELHWAEADDTEAILQRDKEKFDAEHDRIWQMCIDSYQWSDALNTTIMQVGDTIDKHLENKQDDSDG